MTGYMVRHSAVCLTDPLARRKYSKADPARPLNSGAKSESSSNFLDTFWDFEASPSEE